MISITSMGNPRDQMTKCTEFVTIFPHKVGFLRISRFIPDGICSNKAQSMPKIKLFLVV